MRIGLIGENLIHSYSKSIHEQIRDCNYDLISLNNEEFISFMEKKEFDGINVTIPYKEKVIPYLDYVDEDAMKIGAVNTIVKKDNKLYGYNTDAFGLNYLLEYNNINLKNKKVLVLGSGGTSKTAKNVCIKNGAKEVYVVSRNPSKKEMSYAEAEKMFDVNVIINTTPYGMYPNYKDKALIDIKNFPYIEAVVDVIYNPYKTQILEDAKKRKVKNVSGLMMLVAQAVRANELFFDTKYDQEIIKKIYLNLLYSKINIVFIGMPSCGKSNASRYISEVLNTERYDVDEEIEKDQNMTVSEIFAQFGEARFRELETEKIKQLSKKEGIVLSLGGGSLMREENYLALVKNSLFIFLNRSLELLKENKKARLTRPLLNDEEALDRIYKLRLPIYLRCADIVIVNDSTKLNTRNQILEALL